MPSFIYNVLIDINIILSKSQSFYFPLPSGKVVICGSPHWTYGAIVKDELVCLRLTLKRDELKGIKTKAIDYERIVRHDTDEIHIEGCKSGLI